VYIAIIVAAIFLVLIIVIAMQPPDFRVERSATMAAPPASVFAEVNDLHRWEAWSPWAKIDPDMQQTYTGAPAGVGAKYAWNGNKKVGEGRMTITESKPNEFIHIKLEFLRPFAATNETEFTFRPEGGQTLVTWAMTGKKVFLTKAIHLVFSMDKMVGGMFAKGLAQMKAVVESGSK
jgi:hypothetical protein